MLFIVAVTSIAGPTQGQQPGIAPAADSIAAGQARPVRRRNPRDRRPHIAVITRRDSGTADPPPGGWHPGELRDKSAAMGGHHHQVVPKVRDALKLLAVNGWTVHRVQGSHRQLKHLTRSGVVTVPGHPRDELPPGTWRSILKQAGLADGSIE